MFLVIENKKTQLFEVVYAGRVILAFIKREQAQKQADALNGKTPDPA